MKKKNVSISSKSNESVDWNAVNLVISKTIVELNNQLGWFNDEELENTPTRIVNYLKEWHNNSNWDDFKLFEYNSINKYDELVVLKNIEVASLCSHHILPFTGKCHIAYLPDKYVCGVSKLSRTVRKFASRPQIQEQLTQDIADYLDEKLSPRFLMVILDCEHLCMKIRGVREYNPSMVTSAIRICNEEYINLKDEALNILLDK